MEQITHIWEAAQGLWVFLVFIFGGAFAFAMSWKALREYNCDLKKERDDYRKNLHEERDSHQKTRLVLAELEGRPNLNSLETLLRTHVNVLTQHMQDDHVAFNALNTSLNLTNRLLESTALTLDKLTGKL
jgi:hypothetical protein